MIDIRFSAFIRIAHFPEFATFFNSCFVRFHLISKDTPHELIQCISNNSMFEILSANKNNYTLVNGKHLLLLMAKNDTQLDRISQLSSRLTLAGSIFNLVQKYREHEIFLKTSLIVPIRWVLKTSPKMALRSILWLTKEFLKFQTYFIF